MNQVYEQSFFDPISIRMRIAAAALAVGSLLTASACDGDKASQPASPVSASPEVLPSSTPTPEPSPRPAGEGLKDPVAYERGLKIMETFEYSKFEVVFGEAHNVDDGRGITAGIVGFCTGTGDANMVIKELTKVKPDNVLHEKYGERLDAIDKEFAATDWSDPIGSLVGLQEPEKGFDIIKDWNSLADDKDFQAAQLAVYEKLYLNPGLELAQKVETADGNGIDSAAGQLVIVDAAIQHGIGTDPDGLPAILQETAKEAGSNTTEEKFVELFMKNRVQHLSGAADAETEAAWKDSVPRVSALNQIYDNGKNPDLRGPLKFDVYEGDSYDIPAVS